MINVHSGSPDGTGPGTLDGTKTGVNTKRRKQTGVQKRGKCELKACVDLVNSEWQPLRLEWLFQEIFFKFERLQL